ncbi:membrane dipeptidase [uncultured Rubinisphaera sp.]|uniref:dipeptidase n=1 Tax=uncultured Rubinisphaera sp. TaxID=1678686 RepID=UPI002685F024|tara:strand:+ start:1813 stop:2970 length:1158 start_codon:yes stop_codon:yes gene_type:complete
MRFVESGAGQSYKVISPQPLEILMRPLVDAHLDLAWNATAHDRDLSLSLEEMNAAESGMTDVSYRGRATVTFPEMRAAGVFLCLGTLLARSGPAHLRKPNYARTDLDYTTRIGSYAAANAQLACYRFWEQQGEIRLIQTKHDFDEHLTECADESCHKVGVIISMEGADPILNPAQLEEWHQQGLRAIGPAHYGHSHYAGGTAVDGPLTQDGRELLKAMERLKMGLDVTHLCDRSMEEAFELFGGTIWASHHNSRTLVPNDRQLSDEQMQKLIHRDGVIGTACDAWMLRTGWTIGKTTPEGLTLEAIVDHIDHVCQMAGNADHAALGSDLDGGFGTEQTPEDLKSIADLQRIGELLDQRGYDSNDIEQIFSLNWLRLFRKVLPDNL